MPSWFKRRKYSKGLTEAAQARGTEQFRVNRFRQQYFLSNYELKDRGYKKILLIPGSSCTIQGSFDGFISVDHCTIKLTEPKPTWGQRPAPEFLLAVCMIPPDRRASLGVDVEGESMLKPYFVEFWRSIDAGSIGSSGFNPDILLMKVKQFANVADANIAEARMLLSNVAVTLPPVNAEKKGRDGLAIDIRIPGENIVECAALGIGKHKNKNFCYPVMIMLGMEKLMRLSTEGDTTEK